MKRVLARQTLDFQGNPGSSRHSFRSFNVVLHSRWPRPKRGDFTETSEVFFRPTKPTSFNRTWLSIRSCNFNIRK